MGSYQVGSGRENAEKQCKELVFALCYGYILKQFDVEYVGS